MGHLLAVSTLLFLLGPQSNSSTGRIERLPDGTIEQGVYLNSALDISFQIRGDWTAMLIPAGALQFAPERPTDDPVNRCSRAIFVTKPIQATTKPFGPKATYYVFDPECFPGAPFPRSTKDRNAVMAFAQRAVHGLAHTPYVSQKGADVGGFDSAQRAFITLVADRNVEIPNESSGKSDTVHVNTLLMITESNGYWVVLAEAVDDASTRIMQAAGVGVSVRR